MRSARGGSAVSGYRSEFLDAEQLLRRNRVSEAGSGGGMKAGGMFSGTVATVWTMTIKLLVVDDQSSVRAGLRMRLALESDFQIVGEASDGLEALRSARHLEPDVIIMDVEMPRMDGLMATEALQMIAPRSKVVILSIHDNLALRTQAEECGAAAFVAKQEGAEALVAAIRHVSQRA